ncbi:hypothetical protein OB920_19355 [Halobacteria archaeon HArc-gm2]|mgnify:CR=1 FL=1|nr:hypothetical protein [Halobacteria archaeon HArc-gm2]
MTCPFLDYRDSAGDRTFDTARAYCTAAERFVQPMRADVCNDRYDLDHASDCEIFLAHEDELDEAEIGSEVPTEGPDA